MIIFLFYAVFVWYLCFRFRRQWTGVVCFLCSMGALWLLADLYRLAIRWAKLHRFSLLDTRNDGQLFLMLLAVEAVIVAAVGIFFWCLPRHMAQVPCRRCGYELAGLDDDNPTCPECGLEAAAARVRDQTCPQCGQCGQWRTDRELCKKCHTPRATPSGQAVRTAEPVQDAAPKTGPVSGAAFSLATAEPSLPPAVRAPEDRR